MIAFLPESSGRVLGVRLSELVTRADCELRLIPRLEKLIAVIGGPPWVAWSVKCAAFLIRGEVRNYPAHELAEAWKWVDAK